MWYVSEIYRSIQGEGLRAGRPSTFLRLAGCQKRCIWRIEKPAPGGKFTVAYVGCEQSHALCIDNSSHVPDAKALARWFGSVIKPWDDIVITGGEPMQQAIDQLIEDKDFSKFLLPLHVSVETNGMQSMEVRYANLLSITPVITTEDFRHEDLPHLTASIADLMHSNPQAATQIKFMINHVDEIHVVKKFLNEFMKRLCYVSTSRLNLMVCPVSANPNNYDLLTREIIDKIVLADTGLDLRLCDRLQFRIWKGERGR